MLIIAENGKVRQLREEAGSSSRMDRCLSDFSKASYATISSVSLFLKTGPTIMELS